MEIWKDITKWKGLYQVSDKGSVRSLDRRVFVVWRGKKLLKKYKGRILKKGILKSGYEMVSFTHPAKRREYMYVHDLVLLAFEGCKPKNLECCHNNGVKHDNRLFNLRYDTRSNNALDRHKHGTITRLQGEAANSAKLTNRDVYWIRKNKNVLSFREMGRRLGVSHNAVSAVVKKESWGHI